MAQVAISGFVSTWTSSFESASKSIEGRNVRQGGNDLLAAFPLALQATWASTLMAQVAAAVTGPFALIARVFQILFSPFSSFPLAIVSCAAKEGFYEESVAETVAATEQIFERGEESPEPVQSTVTLLVNGVERHFLLGDKIYWLQYTTLIDGTRYWFRPLRANEAVDSECREIEIDGQRIQVRLEGKTPNIKFIEREEGGNRHYYELGSEVPGPIQGTVTVRTPRGQIDWNNPILERHYFLNRTLQETPNCIKIRSLQQMIYYDTGEEISEPEPGSRTFVIDGVPRHFRAATCVREKTEGLSGTLNGITQKYWGISLLPTRLSTLSAKILSLVNQYGSGLIRLTILVSGAVLLYFGSTAMAVGALAALVYESLDHDLGVIPHEISLFMEKWLPTISMGALLIVGSWLSQIMAALSLAMMVPSIQLWVHQMISSTLRPLMKDIARPLVEWFIRTTGAVAPPAQLNWFIDRIQEYPSLEESDAPLQQRREMSREEIDEILNAPNDAYEINPACLTKNIEPPIPPLEQNSNFSLLMQMWDQRAERWPRSYITMLSRLIDDKKFIRFLRPRFPGADRFFFQYDSNNRDQTPEQQEAAARRRHNEQFEAWITLLAAEQNMTKEQFVIQTVRNRLQIYMDQLSGARPSEGERSSLHRAMENTSKIIAFMLRPDARPVDIEDGLIKLAVEGGGEPADEALGYCNLAKERVSDEVLRGFTEPLILQAFAQMSPHERFEREILHEFQAKRLSAIQGFYQQATSFLRSQRQFQDTADDAHLYTYVARALKRGFYPLTEEEAHLFTIPELVFSETMLLPIRAILRHEFASLIPEQMAEYSIDHDNTLEIEFPDLDERGDLQYDGSGNVLMRRTIVNHNKTLSYLRAWVQTNPQLNDPEREELLNGPLAVDAEQLGDGDNYTKWNRLFLTILGLYRKKPAQPAVVAAQERREIPRLPVGATWNVCAPLN